MINILLFIESLVSARREDVASSSTFTLEDSAICLTSEQSTMDVDIDRDDGSVLDVYLVSLHFEQSVPSFLPTLRSGPSAKQFFLPLLWPTVKKITPDLHSLLPIMRQSPHWTGQAGHQLPMLLDLFCYLYCKHIEVHLALGPQDDAMSCRNGHAGTVTHPAR